MLTITGSFAVPIPLLNVLFLFCLLTLVILNIIIQTTQILYVEKFELAKKLAVIDMTEMYRYN